MGVIRVKTTTGEVNLNPEDIDRLTYWIGDKERTVEGPNVVAMFEDFVPEAPEVKAERSHQRVMDKIRNRYASEGY